ncbi:MAG: zinc dependent phospholipase C family protein [Tissierellia bacterium]|nr:zinc dependent phospholipase C family protein [Tissierellia bacterium]
MFKILSDTHKIIAKIIHNRIKDDYDLDLNLEKLQWGAIAPDVLPYYRLKRHYKDESLEYIAKEIVNLILFCRYANLKNAASPVLMDHISKKLGIISHYLADFVCYPHAHRLTFIGNMKNHIKYESELNIFVLQHKFEEKQYQNVIGRKDLNLYEEIDIKLKTRVMNYIDDIVDEYMSEEASFDRDMNFAVDLNTRIAYFVIESIMLYREDLEVQFN